MTPAVVLAVVASLLVAMPIPAKADPVTPPGATTTPPVQQSSSATAPPLVATDATQADPGERAEERDPTVHPVPPMGAVSGQGQVPVPVQTPDRPGGYLEGVSVEVPSLRTPYSTDYVNVDGTRTTKLYGEVAFVPDPAGGLRPLDTSLSVRPNDARIVPAAASDVSFAPTADAPTLARWDIGGGTYVGFGLAGAASVGAATADGVATYTGVRPYADMQLAATGSGVKESIVLRSAAAPTSWRFPLQTGGNLTPRLNTASGSVQFVDRHDTVVATIPPGFMVDSAAGRPARSNRVVYALEEDGSGWVLRVELDAGWLRAPGRVFPVVVDPAVLGESDDTFVSSRDFANRDNSAEGSLYVGTKDGGGDVSASYLHFNLSSVGNRFIFSGGLTVSATDSASCTPKPVTIHAVTQAWAGATTTTWSGPGFEETPLDTQTFAKGFNASCPAGNQFFNLPGGRLTRWAHGLDPFYGFTLRASSTDSLGWKKFSSNSGSYAPNLWLNYVDNGAGYVYPNPMITPTVATGGSTMIRITNLGTTTWTTAANNYRFNYAVLNSSGSFVQSSGLISMPYAVAPNQTVEFPITLNALPLGTYTLRGDMVTPAGESFYLTYAVPMGQVQFTVANGPPVATAIFPEPNSVVDTIRPGLWVRDVDPDQTGTTRLYMFKVCAGTPEAPVDCQDSGAGWVDTQTWVPPTALKWHRQVWWQVRLSDGSADSAWLGPWYFTPTVAQPSITAHLAGASSAEMPGVNPQAGNYSTSVTDAQVNVAGPALAVSRTYNSQDLRFAGAFGTGWSSPVDQKVVLDEDGSGNAVLTLASGLEVRFGANGDGTYSPPQGQNLTLVYTASPASWTLRDRSGTIRTFDVVSWGGRLSGVVDTDGRTQTYTYNGGGELTTITDTASGRALHLSWTSGHVTSVATDVPGVGQSAPTWTYTYTGDKLTSVCNPLGGCVTYTYTSSSHYRSVVSNDAPTGYWPLGETSGTSARNVMATLPAERDGSYNNVSLGAAGPLSGTVDTATTYSSTSPGWVTLPAELVNQTKTTSVELWFQAASGKSGVLFGEQSVDIGQSWFSSSPLLYIGTDGKLRGMAPVAAMESTMVGLASKCVNVAGGNYANGTAVQLKTCDGSDAQKWTRHPDGTVRYFDRCLDIDNYGTTNGSLLQLYQCHGDRNQVWEPYNGGLRNPVSGKCMDLPSSNTTDGTQLQLYTCNGTGAQIWTIPTVVAPMVYNTVVTDGNWHHVVLSVGASGQSLYVDGISRATLTGQVVDHRANTRAYIGALRTSTGWASGPTSTGLFAFTGQIDEVALYQYGLAPTQVTEHYTARNTTQRLATIVEPGPFTAATLTYDSNTGRVATEIDRHGATWTLTGPALTSPAPGEGRRSVTLTSTARTAPVTYTYDSRHGDRLVAHVDAYGTRSYTYDDTKKGFLASTTDENGNTVTQTTDDRGNVLTRTTTREPGVTNTEYFAYHFNAADLLDPRNDVQTRSADARSANATDPTYETLRTIDAAGRVTQISYPKPAGQATNPTEEYVYSTGSGGIPAGLLTSATARNDGVTTHTYNAAGDLLTTTDPVGLVTTHTYDALGRIATTNLSSDASGPHVDYGTTTFTYNGLSQPVTVAEPAVHNPIANVTHTRVTTSAYNALGRVTSEAVSDSTGGDTTRTTTFVYDPAGRPISVTAPDATVTSQTWNGAGLVATTTEPGGLVLSKAYDDNGRVLTTTATGSNVDPANASATSLLLESRGYDPAGRLAVVTDAMGRTTRHTYWQDNLERSRYVDRADPVADVLLQATSYDPAGHPTTVVGPSGVVTTSTYDPAGYVSTQVVDPSGLNRVTTTVHNKDGSVQRTTAATAAPVAGNLSRHHLTTATSASCVATEGPEKAVNDSWTGGFPDKWCSDVAGTKTLQVDLGQQASITDFTLRHAGAGGEQASWNTRAFTIQVSADGATWTTPVTVTANTANETTHPVSTAGRYVRLNITTPTQDGNPAARIYDLTVTGTIGAQASVGRTEKVDYTYDAAGRVLTTMLDNTGGSPAALTTTYVRDARGLVIQETDPAGSTTARSHDLAGRLLSTTGASRTIWVGGVSTAGVLPVTTLGRNTFGEVTHFRDPNSATVVTSLDSMGRTLSTTLPAYTPPGGSPITAVSSSAYNAQGLVTTRTDPLGAATTYTYDKYGRLTTRTDPDPDGAGPKTAPMWIYTYDSNGELLDTTDPVGAHQSATYDELGRPITSTRSERVGASTFYYTTTIGYDNASNPVTSTSPLSHTATAVYNNAGELVQATDPTGRFTRTSRDLAGRPVAMVSGQGASYANPVSTVTYDLAGRAVSTSDCTANGSGGCGTVLRTSTTAFDGASRVAQATSAEGRPTSFGYDGAGQLTSVTQRVNPASGASAITVSLGYDRIGNKTRMVDGNGNATTYTYTPWNLPETVVEPSTTADPNLADRTWTTVYDASGQPVEDRLPGSVTRSRTYDKLGRLTAETGTGATATARSLDYDAMGQVTSATSPAGNLSYTWTDRGLLSTASGYGGTATYTYNGEGQPTARTDGAGAATFGYDNAGRITTTLDPLTSTTATNSYDIAGRLSTVTHGAGKSTREFTYDDLGRVATDTTKKPDTTTAASISFGYDTDGLLTSKTTVGLTGAGANTYTYDGLGRVTSWLNPGGTTTAYGYDAASNRTTVTTPAGTRTSIFDERNRLTDTTGASQPADTYTWTARGTLATATRAGVTTTYAFDAFERLTQAQKAPGSARERELRLQRPLQQPGSLSNRRGRGQTPARA